MTSDLYLYIIGVIVSTLLVNLFMNKFYNIGYVRLILFTLIAPLVGVFTTCIMSYIESGSFRGTSFFGAILFMPIFVLLYSLIFRVKVNKMLNLTSFLGMITSAILKIRCLHYNCCHGKKIPIFIEGKGYLTFPSQIAESLFALVVLTILFVLFKKNRERNDLYPIMMIIYGVGRFILNSYRYVTPLIGFMAWGHIWSIVSVVIGTIWLIILKFKEQRV